WRPAGLSSNRPRPGTSRSIFQTTRTRATANVSNIHLSSDVIQVTHDVMQPGKDEGKGGGVPFGPRFTRPPQQPVLRQNSVRRQVIDLAGLIQRKFRLDGPPPAPPASTASPPLRRSPPCRLGEPGPTPPARRLQEDADPAEGAQE